MSNAEDLVQPANCLCFNLRRAARSATRGLDAALKPAGVTATQFSVLAVLARTGGLSMSGLAARLGADRTTLTRNLALMERNGLIAFAASDDLRERRARVTARGRTALKRATAPWRRFQKRLLVDIGEHDARRLLALLARFA